MLKDLEELKNIAELTNLYLADYFNEVRNDMDKEIVSKQIKLHDDDKKVKQLNELWQKMIAETDQFEKQCIKNKIDLNTNIQRINSIEEMLSNNKEPVDLEQIKETIEKEEISLMQTLFQNKTIYFFNVKDFLEESKRELIDGKLVLLNDETIRKKALKRK